MPITRKVASIAFTGGAAAAAVGMAAAPAMAVSGVWHIKNGGAAYKGAVKGNNKGNTKLVDTTHGVTLTCKKANVSGNVPNSTVTATGASTRVGGLKAANFSSCSFLGVTFKANLSKLAGIYAKTYNSTNGNTRGRIKSIGATITGTNVTCTAKVTGALPDLFHNASHSFRVDSQHNASLTLKSVTAGCPVIANGDKAYFTGTFPITTPAALTISDPPS